MATKEIIKWDFVDADRIVCMDPNGDSATNDDGTPVAYDPDAFIRWNEIPHDGDTTYSFTTAALAEGQDSAEETEREAEGAGGVALGCEVVQQCLDVLGLQRGDLPCAQPGQHVCLQQGGVVGARVVGDGVGQASMQPQLDELGDGDVALGQVHAGLVLALQPVELAPCLGLGRRGRLDPDASPVRADAEVESGDPALSVVVPGDAA